MSGKVAHVGSLVDGEPVFETEFGTITQRNGPARIPESAGLPNARLFDHRGNPRDA